MLLPVQKMPEGGLVLRHSTLGHALRAAAKTENGITFLSRGDSITVSYRDLYVSALQVSHKLHNIGVRPGDKIILVIPTCSELATHYFACVLLGVVPCIQASPRAHASLEDGLSKFNTVVNLLAPRLVITTPSENEQWGSRVAPQRVIEPFDIDSDSNAADFQQTDPDSTDIALVQATSGSTSLPKCIGLTHLNVCTNCQQMQNHWGMAQNDRVVGWLPLFHDMGLIGTFLVPLYIGIDVVLMNPSVFLKRPIEWLRAISDYKGTFSPAPNFAYALVTARVSKDDLKDIDLSTWRAAICGAERINPKTLRDFYSLAKLANLNKNALLPAYGLAEATLCVTGDRTDTESLVDLPESTDMKSLCPLSEAQLGDHISTSGLTVEGTEVTIMSDEGVSLPEGIIGRICIKGSSVMKGYLQSDGSFDLPSIGGMLDTGDMGYLKQGHLFVAGRVKELIIIRGQNYFPTEFETATNEINGFQFTRVMALGIVDAKGESEEVHLILEMARQDEAEAEANKDIISRHVANRTGILPARVEFVPKKTFLLTTSGKLQRNSFKRTYTDALEKKLTTEA